MPVLITLPNQPDIRFDPKFGRGALLDVGSYPVSFIRAMLDADPVEVFGWHILSNSEVDVTFAGQMRFASGALAQLSCSFQSAPHWEAEIVGSQGMIWLDLPWQHDIGAVSKVQIYQAKKNSNATFGDSKSVLDLETITDDDSNAYNYQIEAMESACLDGADPVIPASHSKGTITAISALYRSSQSGQPVTL